MAYFDILRELRQSKQLRTKLTTLTDEVSDAERAGDTDKVASKMVQLFQTAGYNAGVLLPYYFPDVLAGDPLNAANRPFSYSMFNCQPFQTITLRGSRQISKSTKLGARILALSDIIPGWRTLYIAPYDEHVRTFGDKLAELWRGFRFYFRENPEFRQNLRYREWPNGSTARLIHLLTDSAASRGKTADEIQYDEYQLFNPDLEYDVSQVQKTSKRPVTIYAGTSTTVDSPLEIRYQESSKGVWIARCEFGHWLNFGSPAEFIPAVKPSGLLCDKCAASAMKVRSRILIRGGEFVHADRAQLSINNTGLHIPQLIIPQLVEDKAFWIPIYRDFVRWDRNKWLEELCAIPSVAGSREITVEHLRGICVNEWTVARMHSGRKSGRYKFLISGADWGGSDDNPRLNIRKSLTWHVIMGYTLDEVPEILYMHGYHGSAYDEIIHDMMRVHKDYGCDFFASDDGVGLYYNQYIHREIDPKRHFVFKYSAPDLPLVSYARGGGGIFGKMLLNRTEALSMLFDRIRGGPSKIRCFNWGEAQDALLQFLNIYRVPAETGKLGGPKRFVYHRQSNKADDACHAVNFAHIGLRLAAGEYVGVDEEVVRSINLGVVDSYAQSSGSRFIEDGFESWSG